MIEKQPHHKHDSPSLLIPVGCFSILLFFLLPSAFGITSSDVTITSPVLNQKFTSTSIPISGTFSSPSNPPSIYVSTSGSSSSAAINSIRSFSDGYTGTWSASLSAGNGWHTVKATISDSNGALTDSAQFYVNDGTTIITPLKFKEIPIEYSQACLAMISHGDYSSCPSMEKLIPVDKSNQKISGHFIQGKYGTIREKPQMQNAQQFYTDTTPCVGCFIDGNSDSQMQIIWIVPHLFPYTLHNFTSTTINDTSNSGTYHISTVNEQNAGLTIYHDKYVDEACMSAQVVYKDENTIPDTIKYMTGNCKDKSYFNTTRTIIPDTPWDSHNPLSNISLKYKAVVDHVKALHPGNCQDGSCGLTTSTKKAGW